MSALMMKMSGPGPQVNVGTNDFSLGVSTLRNGGSIDVPSVSGDESVLADLVPASEVAVQRWNEARVLANESRNLSERLETRKLVERAKGVLMDSQNLKEAEAFRRIQRLSMNSRKSMREVAEAILLAHEAGRSL